VVDTTDGLFVVKFRGAGQGPKALVAELIAGGVAEAIGLEVPELVLVEISELFGRGETDPEIQDLLRTSHGTNVGLRYLDGAFNFALAAAGELIDPEWAARVVWLDAFLTNPDRTHRNPNILIWSRRPWLIDHGAALYAHHDWQRVDAERTRSSFPLVKEHVLLSVTGDLEAVDAMASAALTEEALRRVLASLPDELLAGDAGAAEFASPSAARERYLDYLVERLTPPRSFVTTAIEAQRTALADATRRLSARR
jgi:hypothetical protein